MQACKYNTTEFAPFTSGKKRIKPEPTDDWKVTTGGFRNANNVLNLTSAKLNQTIYDISSDSFFKFMKNEKVTMNGDEIVGTYAIGTQRVLRKEEDYLATMSKITERKSTVIAKKDMILGHEYETVCGSTFIFAGTRYFIKSVRNKNGLKITNNKKYYLAYNGGKNSFWYNNVSDVTAKKVVKDLGMKKDKKYLDDKIETYINKKQEIIFYSETLEKPKFELCWRPTNINLLTRHGRSNYYEFIQNSQGVVYIRTSDHSWKIKFNVLKEEKGLWSPSEDYISYDDYDNNNKLLSGFSSVEPFWLVK